MRSIIIGATALTFLAFAGQDFAKTSAARRDPTKPAISAATTPTEQKIVQGTYELQSIIMDKTRQVALINGKFVSIGDNVGGARVIAIKKNSVTLSESGKRITIFLFDRRIWK